MPTEMRDLINFHQQLGDFNRPHFRIRFACQFLYAFRNFGFQMRDAHFICITSDIWQVVLRKPLPHTSQLLVEFSPAFSQIGFRLQGRTYWGRSSLAEFLPGSRW